MDMHAAREALREERDRQMRFLQDDDRRRGILSSAAVARREGLGALMSVAEAGSGAAAASDASPRARVVSGVAQVVAPRDPSPHDAYDGSDSILCVITLVSAINPAHSWTMPATSHLWNELEAQALVPYTDPPVPLHRTVVATSTHTQRSISLISEYVRDVMLGQTECTTCILSGPRILQSDRTFWTTWDPAVPVDADDREAANLAAAEEAYEPHLPTTTMAFPGELLQPAPALVGKVWPSDHGSAQIQKSMDDDDV